MKTLRILLVISLVISNFLTTFSQNTKQLNKPIEEDTIKISSFLVNLPMVVSDKQGRYLSDLKKEDFNVYENNVEQEIAFFSNQTVPCHIVLVLDCSGSTNETLTDIRNASTELIKSLEPQDQAMIITFADNVITHQTFTSDKTKLMNSVNTISAAGSTKLYDAVYLASRDVLSKIPGRKALVLLTDGQDTSSSHARQETIDKMVESGSLAYVIQYPTAANSVVLSASTDVQPTSGANVQPPPQLDNFPPDTGFLSSITEVTGGRFYKSDIGNLAVPMRNVASELRNVYVMSYYPSNPIENKGFRKIKVKPRKNLSVAIRYRSGYDAEKIAKSLAKEK